MKLRSELVGVTLLCAAFGSEALTLGRVRGAVLVGQPLNVVVPVQMDAGEDASTLCFDAEVFHADTRQEPSRVRVQVEPTAQAHAANVRVLSSMGVDEPVVTVYLHAGCAQKTTRRYVLLADFPSEVAAPAESLPSDPVAVLPPVQKDSIPVVPTLISTSPQVSRVAPAVKVKKIRASTPSVRPEVVPKPPAVKASAAAPTRAQPRLKLDTLELLSGRVADMESSMKVTPPDEALRTTQQMQALQEDVKALLTAATKNEANLTDLKTRLQKAESERFPGGVIYGLIALVLACLAAIAFLWNRQRRIHADGHDWWSGAPVPVSSAPEPASSSKPLQERVVAPWQQDDRLAPPKTPVVTSNFSALASEPRVKLMEVSESDFDQLMQSESSPREKSESPLSPPAAVAQTRPIHKLDSEAVLDIRQQAEFFVSLGQTDRATRILKKQIDESSEPNPFVYLDLLNLFHSHSLKVDFQLLRKDFNQLFSGRVPEFALFKNEGHGLEFYSELMSRITALWPMHNVLEVIEACIFQDPWDTKGQPLDLAAFRDLLMLHAIAQTVVITPSSGINGRLPISSEVTGSLSPLDLDLSAPDVETHPTSPLPKSVIDASAAVDIGDLLDFELPKLPPT